MAKYNIKIVDHTSSDTILMRVEKELSNFFARVFAQTSDQAIVARGQGSPSDTIVLHFVNDIADSYIRKTLKKDANINPSAGGHTTLHRKKVCSEFYKTVVLHGKLRPMSARDYARLAFHECLHNVFPAWKETDLKGHGGLSDTPVGNDLSQWDIDTMRRGIAIQSVATQQL